MPLGNGKAQEAMILSQETCLKLADVNDGKSSWLICRDMSDG